MTGYIVGIDPGLSGAVAILGPHGDLMNTVDMPAADGHVIAAVLASHIDAWHIDAAWVERVHSMPRQGVASTFKFGVAYGTTLGVLGALHIPTHHVTPNTWKKAAGLSADKGAARRRATDLWPTWASHFARVKDDGRAEAALIARHGWLQMTRRTNDD
jgi:crossover junction endodeoxyribonuclease RuvC